MKKVVNKFVVGSLVVTSLMMGGVSQSSVLAADTNNNTYQTAQRFSINPSYSLAETLDKRVDLTGTLSSVSEEDWYVTTWPNERGAIARMQVQTTTEVAMFVLINGQLVDISTIRDLQTLAGKDVYIRAKAPADVYLGDYTLRLYFGANPIGSNDPHEPNDYIKFENGKGIELESTLIPNNTLVATKWNTDFDGIDNFRIETNKTKGTLSFEVHYPADEFNHWKSYNLDHYLVYELFAELNDGTFTKIWSKAQVGMPNQVFSGSVNIDNAKYTGKYFLSVNNNSKVNKNYQVKFNFAETPVVTPTPTPTPTPVPTPTPTPAPQQVTERLAGETRFGTNLALTKKIASKSLDTVILANAWNYPDALAGGVLNNTHNGAVILVDNNQTNISNALNETSRLLKSGGKVYILGGEAAVSNTVENAFRNQFSVERIGGIDRVETSIQIAKKAVSNPTEIFITYGFNYADALSIVPYAAEIKAPILLNNNASLDSRIASYIKEKGIKKVTLVGGTAVLSPQIESSLRALNVEVQRVSGDTRYATALAIAKKYYPNTTSVGIASGESFADALSGSRIAIDHDMPIVLTRKGWMESDVQQYAQSKDNHYILGGTAVIGNYITDILK
ncbi:cell wall-binding repeat-containing protein [Robertmurraya beringensis]|uniref:Cell wall-binding repeat-containing protein n=1 Tax=Robertmurraya beringensis TaxID=641660 RepID=A0ABV6KRS8_9BACI